MKCLSEAQLKELLSEAYQKGYDDGFADMANERGFNEAVVFEDKKRTVEELANKA